MATEETKPDTDNTDPKPDNTDPKPKTPAKTTNENTTKAPKPKKEFELEDLLYCVPNKITFDPKKTNPLVHLGFFVGLISLMFLLSFMLNDIGTIPEHKKNKSIKGVKNSLEKFVKSAKLEDKWKDLNKEVCDLYIASSSIPGKKYGIFAGKSFAQGSEVLNEGISVLLNGVELELPHLLISSHPNITNVIHTREKECKKEPYEHCIVSPLQALREIQPGDELFLNEGKQRLEDNNEMNGKYKLLDDIIKDILHSHRPRRAGNQVHNNFGLNDSILRTIKSIVNKFDPSISSLIPFESSKLKDYAFFGSAYYSLQNRTLPFLLRNGVCLSSSRNVQKNENITRIPVIPIKDDLPFVKHWNCFLYPPLSTNQSYYLCPTISTKFSRDENKINAKYEWVITLRKGKEFLLSSLNSIDNVSFYHYLFIFSCFFRVK